MIALDANILARYLLSDSQTQADVVDESLNGGKQCSAPITVFLELVWVLESCDCERPEIAKSIRLPCGMDNFKQKNLDALVYAL